MPARSPADQIAFRYRTADSATGVTRDTAKRLAERPGASPRIWEWMKRRRFTWPFANWPPSCCPSTRRMLGR